MIKQSFAVLAALTLVVLTGCGGGDAPKSGTTTTKSTTTTTPAAGTPKAANASGGEAYDKAKHKGVIKGVVSYEGEAPPQPKIKLDGNPDCAKLHGDTALLREELVVKGGKLKNATVYIKKASEKYTYAPNTEQVLIDQKGCQYLPHVLAVTVDQPILIRNSDEIVHNVHGISGDKTNPEFNISQPKKGDEKKHTFKDAEIGYKIKCDVHQHMSTWVSIFDHPFFAVTGDDGAFNIAGVPAGEYELELWHEAGDKVEIPKAVKVTVKEDGSTEPAEIKFAAKGK